MSRVKLFPFPLILSLIVASTLPLFAAPQKSEDAAKTGAALFSDKGCTYCHGSAGQGAKKGPALTDVWKDKTWTN